jgi:hypothetical protein
LDSLVAVGASERLYNFLQQRARPRSFRDKRNLLYQRAAIMAESADLNAFEARSFSWLSSNERIFLSEWPNGPYGFQPGKWRQIGKETDNFPVGATGF